MSARVEHGIKLDREENQLQVASQVAGGGHQEVNAVEEKVLLYQLPWGL